MLGDWVDHWHAYDGGPVVSDHPFAEDWERSHRTHDGHAHEWEHIIWGDQRTRRPDGGLGHVERIRRCRICLAPGCGHTGDRTPCREVRHHSGPHWDGERFEPVGGSAYAPIDPAA